MENHPNVNNRAANNGHEAVGNGHIILSKVLSGELLPHHRDHLYAEGFTTAFIEILLQMGVRSVTEAEARKLGFIAKGADGQMHCGSGIYLPFTPEFAQLRLDQPIERENGAFAKYLTQCGVEAAAYYPLDALIVTEGFKDALIVWFMTQIQCAAVAGVSHICKALPAGCGLTTIFDSDAWTNPSVMMALIRAGLHLNGKINIIPEIPGHPKAGFCEYFKAGYTVEHLRQLIANAYTPKEMLWQWASRFAAIPQERLRDGIKKLFKLAAELCDEIEHHQLLTALKTATRIGVGTLKKWLDTAIKALQQKTQSPEQPSIVSAWSQSRIAKNIAEKYSAQLAYDLQIQAWRRYGIQTEGIWTVEPVQFIRRIIRDETEHWAEKFATSSGPRNVTNSVVAGIEKLLQDDLAVRQWDEVQGLLPLKNGVLDLETRSFKPHSPDHHLTWCLPYQYSLVATCVRIREWLYQMCQQDRNLVQLMRAYLYAIVAGRTDLQQYLELIGPGGTGKSTYIRLAMALVGVNNTHTTALKKLENGQFETACIEGKRLVVITDSERYAGEVNILKALTGQDSLPYERKWLQSTGGFVPQAMVIVASNETIQSSDYTSGLKRRRITVPMIEKVPAGKQRNLIEHLRCELRGEFVPEIPGLLNWVLAMEPKEAEDMIKNYRQRVPILKQKEAETLVQTNPIADWVDRCLVERPGHRTQVGVAKRDKSNDSDNWYVGVDNWLYASYSEYAHNTGTKAVALRRFSNLVDDLFCNQLQLNIKHGRDRDGSYFLGVKIRTPNDLDPLLITGDSTPPPDNPPPTNGPPPDNLPPTNGSPPDNPTSASSSSRGSCSSSNSQLSSSITKVGDRQNETDVMVNVMAQTPARDKCDGCDGKNQPFVKPNQKNNSTSKNVELISQESGESKIHHIHHGQDFGASQVSSQVKETDVVLPSQAPQPVVFLKELLARLEADENCIGCMEQLEQMWSRLAAAITEIQQLERQGLNVEAWFDEPDFWERISPISDRIQLRLESGDPSNEVGSREPGARRPELSAGTPEPGEGRKVLSSSPQQRAPRSHAVSTQDLQPVEQSGATPPQPVEFLKQQLARLEADEGCISSREQLSQLCSQVGAAIDRVHQLERQGVDVKFWFSELDYWERLIPICERIQQRLESDERLDDDSNGGTTTVPNTPNPKTPSPDGEGTASPVQTCPEPPAAPTTPSQPTFCDPSTISESQSETGTPPANQGIVVLNPDAVDYQQQLEAIAYAFESVPEKSWSPGDTVTNGEKVGTVEQLVNDEYLMVEFPFSPGWCTVGSVPIKRLRKLACALPPPPPPKQIEIEQLTFDF